MSWLEEVRQRSRTEKIKLIWKITAVAAFLLIIAWIIIGRYGTGAKKDTSLFKAIDNGVNDFKLENPPTTNTSN